jgi:two-component system sensor histidine kinase DegS
MKTIAAGATEQQEAQRAVDAANALVREQLARLRSERDKLAELLRVRETDLAQLLRLVDELADGAGQVGILASIPMWAAQLEGLKHREECLRDSVRQLHGAVGRLNVLLTAVASAIQIGDDPQSGAASQPLRAAITGRMLEGQEAERFRLAREVHDGPAQVLANAIMGLEYCERLLEKRPAALRGELQRMKAGLADSLEEVRRFIFDLRPSGLEQEGLGATLEGYAASYEERYGIAVRVRRDEVDEVLSPEERFAVFRVIQESLQNARKHSEATRVEIALERHEDHVVVSVADNGRGFDPNQARRRDRHHGLQGMRERAELVHGSLALLSEPGCGTEVRMTIPLVGQETDPSGGAHA